MQRDKVCGWLESLPETTGVAVYDRAPTGLGDIWSSMLTAFWWATAHGRKLVVHWPESRGTVVMGSQRSADVKRLETNLTFFKRTHLTFRNDWLHGRHRGLENEVVLSGNRGLTRWLMSSGISLPDGIPRHDPLLAAGCVLHRLATPTKRAYELLKPLLAEFQKKPTVCLHIRTGLMLVERKGRPDDEMHGASRTVTVKDVPGFMKCADPTKQWFLAADSESLRADLLERYPDNVVVAPWLPDPFATYQAGGGSSGGTSRAVHRSREVDEYDADALTRTFAEWYALAHCDTIIASRSGFSRTAAVVARALRNATVRIIARADDLLCRSANQSRTDRLLLDGGAGI